MSDKTGWQEMAPPTPKDTRMPMTEAYFYKVLAMDDELIAEQKAEISKLKRDLNKLTLKLNSLKDK